MSHFFDDMARAIGSDLSRRAALRKAGGVFVGAALGLFGFGGRAQGETLLNCNNYCKRYPSLKQFIACRNACLTCASAGNMCGTGAAPTCCTGGANGTPSCVSNTCGITCTAGFANCDGSLANGCEVNTNTSNTHCGGCNIPCTGSVNNGSKSCIGGTCTVVCNAGFGNCNGLSADGCEVNTNTDTNNCGTCGHRCTGTTLRCVNGTCVA